MGKGRRIEHLLPSLFSYIRLSPASSDSLAQPLLESDHEGAERIEQNHHEIKTYLKRNAELEKEVHRLQSDLSKLSSQLTSLTKLLPHKGDNMGQEEIREIKELKFRVSKLELVNHVEPLMKKQEKAIEKLQESSAAMEKKITQLMTQVADLQKLHRNQAVKKEYATDRTSIMEKRITDLTAQVAEVKSKRHENDRASITEKKITELTAQVAELKSRSLNSVSALPASSSDVLPGQKPESPVNELVGCLVVLIFLISVLIGLNI